MKKKTLLVCGAAVACSAMFSAIRSDYYAHKEAAPGWKIVTDGKGHYAAQSDSGHVLEYRRHFMYSVVRSKQAALNATWEQYEYETNSAHYQGKWR